MPGLDPRESAAISVGEFDIPFLCELPARGPGADMIGRTLGLVRAVTGDFAAETTASGWRLAAVRAGAEPGRVMRRAASWLGEDLDAFEEAAAGYRGDLKVAVAGPWTTAASLEDRTMTRVLADPGACTELAGALGESVTWMVAQVRRRLPAGDRLIVQLDEPMLPLVLAGAIATPSGRGRLPAPPQPHAVAVLEQVVAAIRGAGATPALHCCGRHLPFDLLARAGLDMLSLDLGALSRDSMTDLGGWWDNGGTLGLGVLPAIAPMPAQAAARQVARIWTDIGFGPAQVGSRTLLTPSCGLAGASPQWARSVGGVLRRVARMVADVS